MSDKMKNRRKTPDDYPRISFRIPPDLLLRADTLRGKGGMSYGQIINQSLRKYLPDLEKFHGLKEAK